MRDPEKGGGGTHWVVHCGVGAIAPPAAFKVDDERVVEQPRLLGLDVCEQAQSQRGEL